MADDTIKDIGGVCFDVVGSVEIIVRTNQRIRKTLDDMYLPFSQAGEPIALSSRLILKRPSKGRSSRGLVTSAEMRTIMLEN